MLNIAITGSTGLVGSRIVELLSGQFNFIHLLQSDVDITNKESVQQVIGNLDFDILLHLAGYTNVDGAEREQDIAYKINVEGTKNTYDAVLQKGKKLIYISTDFVFDGTNPPYFEDSDPNPLGVYAKTKYEGEKIVKENSMIVRISYPYRTSFEPKQDFVRKLKSLLESGKELQMMTDAAITPTFIDDIAYSLSHLFQNYSNEIFHIVGGENLSPLEAGKLIAKTFNLPESLIKPTTFAEYSKNKAQRSQYSIVKSKKNTFHKMRTFEEGLKEIVKQSAQNNNSLF